MPDGNKTCLFLRGVGVAQLRLRRGSRMWMSCLGGLVAQLRLRRGSRMWKLCLGRGGKISWLHRPQSPHQARGLQSPHQARGLQSRHQERLLQARRAPLP